MYDKQVRRRRATALGLIVLSLLMLTLYFGESERGGLHGVQRGALSVLGPIQEGANRALEPVRDVLGWTGDTVNAKQERDRLQRATERLEQEIADLQDVAAANAEYKRVLGFNDDYALDQYGPVRARVTASAPNLFYAKVVIDKGSSAGVRAGQAVVSGAGLVGRVTTVSAGYSQVTLITDESFGTGVQVLPAGRKATAQASVNHPGELELTLVKPERLDRGDRVVTDSSTELERPSYYPPDVLVGTVETIDPGDRPSDAAIRVEPAVDLAGLTHVDVLTRPSEPRTIARVAP